MQSDFPLIPYEFSYSKGMSFSPEVHNLLKPDKSQWTSSEPLETAEICFKFQPTQINSLELRNGGTPSIEIELFEFDDLKNGFICVPKTTLFNIQYFSGIDDLSKLFIFKFSDMPDFPKKNFSRIVIRLFNPFFNDFPRKLGLSYLAIFTNKKYEKNQGIPKILQVLKEKTESQINNKPTEKNEKNINLQAKFGVFKERIKEEKKIELELPKGNKLMQQLGKIDNQKNLLIEKITKKDAFGNNPLSDKHKFFEQTIKKKPLSETKFPPTTNNLFLKSDGKNLKQSKLNFRKVQTEKKNNENITINESDEDENLIWALLESKKINDLLKNEKINEKNDDNINNSDNNTNVLQSELDEEDIDEQSITEQKQLKWAIAESKKTFESLKRPSDINIESQRKKLLENDENSIFY